MKVQAIVNPVSGRRNVAGVLDRVGRILSEAGWSMSVRLSKCPGDVERIATEVPEDTHAILAVGGDGTVREVVDGQLRVGGATPVAIMRTGTENIVSKYLGMSRDPARIARTLMSGHPGKCDVGVVNGRHFMIVTGVGFDAEVVDRLAACRNGHITHYDYFWPIWRTFWAHRFPRLVVWADGQQVFDDHGLAFVGVIPRYSIGLQILRQARRDDGMLDLCVLPCRTRRQLLRHAAQVAAERHDRHGALYRKCRQLRIESPDAVSVEIDGDCGGRLPVECSVLPAAATFLLPPEHTENSVSTIR